MLWNISKGATSKRRSISAKIRLHVYVCETHLLDEVSVNELYTFLIKMMDSDVTIRQFHTVLLSYSYALIFRERKDGSLRGVTLLNVSRRKHGKNYTLLQIGLSFFQNYYRGGPMLYYVVAYHILKELILHPFTPLYIIGKAFSYKSYVVLCHTLPLAYPRYDAETPEFEKGIINEFGTSVKLLNEVYDEEMFVLKRERTSMKEGVAVLTPESLNDPHIKFFVERNPGWRKGHQLITMGLVRWSDFLRLLWRALGRTWRAKRERVSSQKKVKLTRRFSFQNRTLNRYATDYSEVDAGGSSIIARDEQELDIIDEEDEGTFNNWDYIM